VAICAGAIGQAACAGDVRVDLVESGSEHSILGELTSWRHGRRSGLCRYRVSAPRGPEAASEPSSLDLMVKLKAIDTDVLDVGQTVASLVSVPLGEAYRHASRALGVVMGHERELALYDLAPPEVRRLMPVCHGTWRAPDRGEWGLVLEAIDDAVLLDATGDPLRWTTAAHAAAIDGMAALHAGWLPLVTEVARAPWLGVARTAETAATLAPLWQALADHADPFHRAWADETLVRVHRRLVDEWPAWWAERGVSAIDTVIHHDFNPRNVALRRADGGDLRICAYDWELATIGPPQRDLAEWLCFVLPEQVDEAIVWALVERHRAALGVAIGRALDPDAWWRGTRAALAEVLVDRLAFYTMIQRVRPQAFLPRVLRVWRRLYQLVEARCGGR
jgi:hypothetical protein